MRERRGRAGILGQKVPWLSNLGYFVNAKELTTNLHSKRNTLHIQQRVFDDILGYDAVSVVRYEYCAYNSHSRSTERSSQYQGARIRKQTPFRSPGASEQAE